MADAEIIPIGTRGQPGRGTGKRPSAAARGLAPKSTARKSAKKPEQASTGPEQPQRSEQPQQQPAQPQACSFSASMWGAESVPRK